MEDNGVAAGAAPLPKVAEARTATVVDILKAARDLIADRNNWTTGVLARDANGIACGLNNEEACRWCAEGAVYRASDELDGYGGLERRVYSALEDALESTGFGSIPTFNDHSRHADVLALFDRAIAARRSEV